MENRSRIKIIAPIGELPSPDPELEKRLLKVPKDAPLSDVLRVISEYEPLAVQKFRQMEKTKKSGRVDGEQCMCILRRDNLGKQRSTLRVS